MRTPRTHHETRLLDAEDGFALVGTSCNMDPFHVLAREETKGVASPNRSRTGRAMPRSSHPCCRSPTRDRRHAHPWKPAGRTNIWCGSTFLQLLLPGMACVPTCISIFRRRSCLRCPFHFHTSARKLWTAACTRLLGAEVPHSPRSCMHFRPHPESSCPPRTFP